MGTAETLLFVSQEWHHLTSPERQNDSRTPVVNAVFLDIAKCFDRIDRRLLLHKLRTEGGLLRRLCRLLESFLQPTAGRPQRVEFGSSLSEPVTVRAGVPQGACLSPILAVDRRVTRLFQ